MSTGNCKYLAIQSRSFLSSTPRHSPIYNFETPYNALDGSQKVEDILHQLARLSHVAILFTMRGRYPPCDGAIRWQLPVMNMGPIEEAACLRIYHSICPGSENDPDVGTLLRVLGYMPLPVTLMARLADEGMVKAKALLSAWSERQ
jgi:hypothetical protein